jgi:hypothetical protein
VTPPRIRATLADGRVLTGPVGGQGGMVGAGAAGRESAVRSLRRVLDTAWWLYPQGSIRIYPDYCAASDGEPVDVPVKGTEFEVLSV